MRISTIAFCFSIIVSSGFAQTLGVSPYVFPQFIDAKVLQKGGGITEAKMNYNTLTEEMVFLQGTDKLVLDQAANIDTIYLQNKKFVPVNKVYYEKIAEGKIALYEQHHDKLLLKGKNFDLDNHVNSAMTASQGYVKAKEASTFSKYSEQLGDGYTLEPLNTFWLQKGKTFYSADGLKKIVKVFPNKEQAINNYVKDNDLDLNKPTDLAKLIVFCNLP